MPTSAGQPPQPPWRRPKGGAR
uniref:Uncharacterized protein n=1 Tax=Arundo donax TaxID=35708 RepID=A0A0A9DWT7_ARUDO